MSKESPKTIEDFFSRVIIDPSVSNPQGALNLAMEVTDLLATVARFGGDTVSDEQAKARYNGACKGCPYAEMVYYTPYVQFERCQLCLCPLETKCKTLKNISVKKLFKMVTTSCPHPDGNKWQPIDQQFQ
jgi:hypothetical protein